MIMGEPVRMVKLTFVSSIFRHITCAGTVITLAQLARPAPARHHSRPATAKPIAARKTAAHTGTGHLPRPTLYRFPRAMGRQRGTAPARARGTGQPPSQDRAA